MRLFKSDLPMTYSLRVPPSKELCFPPQPSENLLEFKYDGEIVASITADCKFACNDKEKLIDDSSTRVYG